MSDDPTTDQLLVRALVADDALWSLPDKHGLEPEHLSAKARAGLDRIRQYRSTHGELPSQRLITRETGWPHADPDALEVGADYLADQIRKRAIRRTLEHLSARIDRQLDGGSDAAYDAREEAMQIVDERLRRLGDRDGEGAQNVFDLYPDVWERYERIKSGEVGIETPWPTSTEATGGFELGDTVYLVARPQTGKTFMLIYLTIHFWQKGLKVLTVSPEMSAEQIAARHACILTNTNYGDYSDGKLGDYAEDNFLEQLTELKDHGRYRVVEAEMDEVDRDAVERQIDRHDPDVIALDSIQLYGDGYSRSERVENASPWVAKRAGQGRDRLVVASTQLNRSADGEPIDEIHSGHVYGTDTLYQDADQMLALAQTPDDARDQRMGLKPLKVREGESHDPIYLHWNFDTMDFSEIDPPEPPSGAMLEGGGPESGDGGGGPPEDDDGKPMY